MIRVAYFVGNHQRFTGSQRSLHVLVRGLDRTRVAPLVVVAGEGVVAERFRALGVAVHVVPAPGALARFGGSLLRAGLLRRALLAATAAAPYAARLARWLRRERVDVLHCNDARALLLAGAAGRGLGIPTVWHVRGDTRHLGPLYLRACGLLATRLILVADGLRAALAPRLQRKAVTVHNGIDLAGGAAARDRAALLGGLGLDPARPVVLFVGSLVPFKGAHHLVTAARALPQASFVLVGDRPDAAYGAWLDERVAALGVGERVRFAGWEPDPSDWFRAAGVVCLPSVERETLAWNGRAQVVTGSEGFSRTVLEAMAFARPVVASAVAGVPEQVVPEATGLLVPPSDPDALAAALARALARPDWGAAGARRAAARFSVAGMVAKTMQVYQELLSSARLTLAPGCGS